MQHAVVTGATRGIGRAVAERFAASGFHLFVTARDPMELQLMKKELEKKYKVRVYFKAANFAKKADVVLFAEFVREHRLPVDVLVNNVGLYQAGKLFDEPGDKLLEQLNINLMGAHYLTSALAGEFKKNGKGHIFTIGSLLGRNIREDAAFYTISKHALAAWHRLLFEEMRPYRVKATHIMPSSTYTSSWINAPVKQEELIQPEAVAEAIYNCYNMGEAAVIEELVIKTLDKKYD